MALYFALWTAYSLQEVLSYLILGSYFYYCYYYYYSYSSFNDYSNSCFVGLFPVRVGSPFPRVLLRALRRRVELHYMRAV